MNVNIRSSECAWKHAELILLGRTIKGLRGFQEKKTTEKEHLFGAGQTAIDIQEGNITCDGNIKILGFELDILNSAAQASGYSDITEVPHEAIVLIISFKKSLADKRTTINVRGVAFTENPYEMEQNAKMRETTLPFLAMDIVPVTI